MSIDLIEFISMFVTDLCKEVSRRILSSNTAPPARLYFTISYEIYLLTNNYEYPYLLSKSHVFKAPFSTGQCIPLMHKEPAMLIPAK